MDANRIIYLRDLIAVLTAKEFKLRYKSTVLGYAWSVLHPLAFSMVYFLLFKIVMRVKMDNYALFLITGLFPWQWFSNSISVATMCFLENRTLIKKVKFPRNFLVLSGVVNDMVHFIATIPVIVLFMLIYGKHPSMSWLYQIPILVAMQFGFTYGLALTLATWNLFFRDIERLTNIITMMWFFLTPILFNIEMVPARYRWIEYFNPMASIIMCWRSLFLEGTIPLGFLAAGVVYAAAAVIMGGYVYEKMEWRFAEIV